MTMTSMVQSWSSRIVPAIFAAGIAVPAAAMPFEAGGISGSFDTTLSYGMQFRTEDREPSLIGIANGGTAFSVNNDDGDLNYSRGVVSSAAKATHDLQLRYENYSVFVRGSYFYDFTNADKDELTEEAEDSAGSGGDLLDAYGTARYKIADRRVEVRLGKQVVSWGEGLFIQNGINIVNPFDVSRLRVPGSELKEALVPSPLVYTSLQLSEELSLESFYLFRFDRVKLDVCGTFFSTSDFACEHGSDVIWGGFGLVDEGTPGAGSEKLANRSADDAGQFGAALRYSPEFLDSSELGLYFINYHSRLPVLSAVATGRAPQVFFEYPEDIKLIGTSFTTQLGGTGIVMAGEYSHRLDAPLQIEGTEVLIAAQGAPLTQLTPVTAPGEEVDGFERHDVGQWQMNASKSFGSYNPVGADEWIVIGEVGATEVYNLPSESELRFEAPNTNLPADPRIEALGLAPGTQNGGFADEFSWGYVLATQFTYEQAIGAVNLIPRLAFSHDVNGTTPGPAATFIEERKALSLSVEANYLVSWVFNVGYTRFFDAGARNALQDRDFVFFDLKYSF